MYINVAPFTGAWIEILDDMKSGNETLSHPSRVRGLKYLNDFVFLLSHFVAPFTGAWIEIIGLNEKGFMDSLGRTLHGCVD